MKFTLSHTTEHCYVFYDEEGNKHSVGLGVGTEEDALAIIMAQKTAEPELSKTEILESKIKQLEQRLAELEKLK